MVKNKYDVKLKANTMFNHVPMFQKVGILFPCMQKTLD